MRQESYIINCQCAVPSIWDDPIEVCETRCSYISPAIGHSKYINYIMRVERPIDQVILLEGSVSLRSNMILQYKNLLE